MLLQNDGTEIWVLRFWYQDPGDKILVAKKTESLRGGASQKSAKGTGGCRPPARRSGGLEAHQEQPPPSKNNFMDPEPESIVNPETQKSFVNPEIHRESRNPKMSKKRQ